MTFLQVCLVAIPFIPGAAFLCFAFAWLMGYDPRERTVGFVTNLSYLVSFLASLVLMAAMAVGGMNSVTIEFGRWFSVGNYHFPLVFFVDWLSAPLTSLTILLAGLASAFSQRYVHREKGFFRFFLLLNVFTFGAVLVFTAGSFDLIIGGWELVGITSVLLISFFQDRPEPVRNAIRVFATYRGCDIGLLVGVFYLYHEGGLATFERLFIGNWPIQSTTIVGTSATIAAMLLLLAAMGKSAQVPFSGWLPRAMEGPTPSSAIFYGAISVHIGAYLLLRCHPLLEQSLLASSVVVLVGFLSAAHGTFVGRACADAKTQLAYAALAQVGLIFMEIGLGFPKLALVHIIGHALVRMLQFLRAPSMLHEYHGMHAAAGGHLARTGQLYDAVLPASARSWLYRLALDRGHLDTILYRLLIYPLHAVARFLSGFELRSSDDAQGQLPLRHRPRREPLPSEKGLDG